MIAQFDKFYIVLTKKQAQSVSHPGPCDIDVNLLLNDNHIRQQLNAISDNDLSDALREYGAWNETELLNRANNEQRIIWISGGIIVEDFKA
jgi:hypothetical protein